MKIKRDQGTGAVLILLGLFFGFLTSQFKKPLTPEYPGPKLMPYIAVIMLIVCGVGIFINGCRQKDDEKGFLNKDGWVRVLVTFGVLVLYVLGLKYIGFLICTPIALYAITTYFAKASKIETKLWVRVVFSLVVSVCIWFMYVKLFSMPLPTGELFG